MDIILPEDPVIPLLGIYPRDTPTYNKDTCTTMFIAALFIIARSWKVPRCPSVDEWIQKLWYIYTMEYYLAIRNNGLMKFLRKWMHLENIILNEITQSQKNRHNMQSLIMGYQPQEVLNTPETTHKLCEVQEKKEYILIKIELYYISLFFLKPLQVSLLYPQINNLFSYIIVTYIHMCTYMYPQILNYNLIKIYLYTFM